MGKTGETCETSAQTRREASTPHSAGQASADLCRSPGGFSTAPAVQGTERKQSWHRRNHTSSSSETSCQKSPLAKLLEGKLTQGEEKSMLLKWKPPQIVNGKDDDSLEAVVRFMKETNKREKE